MANTTLLGSTVRHNGGSILMAGNVASTSHTKDLSKITSAYKTVYSSRATETNSRVGTATRPLSTGTYAVMARGKYIAKFLTSGVIAGVSNSVIDLLGKDCNMKTTHKNQTVRRYDNTSWTMQGVLTKGGSAGAVVNLINPAVAGGLTASSDNGVPVSEWLVSGRLTWITGKTPTTTSYSVRKG